MFSWLVSKVFLPPLSPNGATGGKFSQLAQCVKVWSMRSTVDNVYSRRRSLYHKTPILRVYLLHVGYTHGFRRYRLPRISSPPYYNFSTSMFSRMIRFPRATSRTTRALVFLHSAPAEDWNYSTRALVPRCWMYDSNV